MPTNSKTIDEKVLEDLIQIAKGEDPQILIDSASSLTEKEFLQAVVKMSEGQGGGELFDEITIPSEATGAEFTNILINNISSSIYPRILIPAQTHIDTPTELPIAPLTEEEKESLIIAGSAAIDTVISVIKVPVKYGDTLIKELITGEIADIVTKLEGEKTACNEAIDRHQLLGFEAALVSGLLISTGNIVLMALGIISIGLVYNNYYQINKLKRVCNPDDLLSLEAIAANITRQLSIPIDPLLLDLDGDGVETVGLNAGIYFDHAGDGFRELTGFVGVDDGLLALDRNGDGIINSGQELFGDSTILENGSLAENGFKALAELDSNGDGIIDANDERFDDLRVFRDLDQDGETDEGELLTLDEAGVVSLSTDYITAQTDYIDPARLIDAAGNAHRQFGVYTNTEGEQRALTDVWFTTDLTETIETTIEIPEDIVILPNALGTGNVNSLHQAMVRDSTGELQALVTQFLSAETRAERLSLIEPIIYQWTGQTGDYRGHYKASIDTRKIGALEAFYVYEIQRPINGLFSQFQTRRYDRFYRAVFQQLVDVIYYQLSANGHLQLLFDNVTWTQNNAEEWLGDFSRVAEFMFSYATFSPETTADVMQDFAQAIRGVNVHSWANLRRWRDAIDEFATSEGISVYPNEAVELVIKTLTNVTEEARMYQFKHN